MSSDVKQNCDNEDFHNYLIRIIAKKNYQIDKLLIERAEKDCERLLNLRRAAALLILAGDSAMMKLLTRDDQLFIAKILSPISQRLGDILGSLLY
jgi:hypothetical protein